MKSAMKMVPRGALSKKRRPPLPPEVIARRYVRGAMRKANALYSATHVASVEQRLLETMDVLSTIRTEEQIPAAVSKTVIEAAAGRMHRLRIAVLNAIAVENVAVDRDTVERRAAWIPGRKANLMAELVEATKLDTNAPDALDRHGSEVWDIHTVRDKIAGFARILLSVLGDRTRDLETAEGTAAAISVAH